MGLMTNRIHRAVVATALLAGLACLGMAGAAAAQSKGKSIQTEADWVSYDAAASTVTVKVRKPGKRVKDKEIAIRKGKEATFDVKPEGSVLTRTSVKINGRRGELQDIPAGKRVNLYWVVDETMGTKRFARTIDVTLSEEELNERYQLEDE
jgi:hypothetical protein